jgi:hypothetical protein
LGGNDIIFSETENTPDLECSNLERQLYSRHAECQEIETLADQIALFGPEKLESAQLKAYQQLRRLPALIDCLLCSWRFILANLVRTYQANSKNSEE